jgi:DoxX-like family
MIDRVLWSLQWLLAGAFLIAGGTKLAKDRATLLEEPRMAWAREFSSAQIKLIALAEVFGVVGLIVPGALGGLPVVTALTAAGLALLMAGAAFTHARRHESALTALVLGLLSAAVAVDRFLVA